MSRFFESEKERLDDFVQKIRPTNSTNIFQGTKDAELNQQHQQYAKLAFIYLAVDRSQLILHTESLRNVLSDLVISMQNSDTLTPDIFLVFRSIAISLPTSDISSLWPFILLFLQVALKPFVVSPPPTSSNSLRLLLEACKLLDYLLVIASDDFQLYVFVFPAYI